VSHIDERRGKRRGAPDSALPHGPHSLSRAEVAANQRRRLIAATIEVVGEKGYAELTVSDVIKRAGVSRRAFYEHFANREECFLATYDWIMAESSAGVIRALARTNGFPATAHEAIEEIFKRALRQPDAMRVLLVEIGAAGPAGTRRREQLGAAYEGALREVLGLPPGPGPIANPVLRGVIGGVGAVLYAHVQSGRRRQVPDLVAQLVRWAASYWPAPPEFMSFTDPDPQSLPQGVLGGRAPGTLSLGAAESRRRLVGGEHGASPFYVAHSQRERILDAVANLTAANGYAALTVEGIVAGAAISLQAFYEHFPSKEGALLAAYEVGHGKGLALVERAFRSRADWRLGVRAGLHALFDYLASEPSFAHLALVDVFTVSERATERARKGITAYAAMLIPGFELTSDGERPPEVTIEAISGGLFELCLHHALQRRMHELPLMVPRATYLALAPFIGAEAAGAIATAPPGS
jgi:AcrR family transcriptional regulator